MKVSIIIPVYNCQDYVRRCIESALQQTLKEIEIICIDDFSTDNSLYIMNEYVNHSNFKVIRNLKNEGLSKSRNIGVDNARGEYLVFLDADDYIDNTTCEVLYEKAEKNNLDMLAFGFVEEYENKNVEEKVNKYSYKKFSISVPMNGKEYFTYCESSGLNHVISCGYIYKTAYLKQNKIRFYENILHEDLLFYIDSILNANRIGRINDCLYHYVRTSNSITTADNNLKKRFESLCIIGSILIKKIYFYDVEENLKKAMINYYTSIVTSMCSVYEQIDSFEKDEIYNLAIEYPYIIGIISRFYNGFYREKLSEDQMRTIRSYKKILIYGAGKVGKGLEKLLIERGINNYEFVVTAPKDNEKSIASFAENADECLVIIAVKKDRKIMWDNASKLGFKHVFIENV